MKLRILAVLGVAVAGGVVWGQQPFIPTVVATPGSPSRVLYGTYKGYLARSADGGNTWTPVYVTEPGLPQPPVGSLSIDLTDSNTLYLATAMASGGVWRSSDGGVTWVQANTGLPPNGGMVQDLKQVGDPSPALYARVAGQLFRSTDHGTSWTSQGALPGGSGALAIADAPANVMYFVDANALTVYESLDFGHSWALNGTLPVPPAPGQVTVSASILATSASSVYVSVVTPGQGGAAYLSTTSGGTFTDETSAGLGQFTKIDSSATGPVYAFGINGNGFYRSDDNGQSWHAIGVSIFPYTLTAVDPQQRNTIYAVRGGASPAFVRSDDAGVNWTTIPATITPTLAKPVTLVNAVVEENAPYSQAFTVQAFEDPSWSMAVTLTTSGEPWLQLASTSGNTPLLDSLNINTAGMAPGTYQSSIRIAAARSFNQSVTIPVTLTIRPAGSLGPQYTLSTAAGNGNATGPLTSGGAATVAIGAAKALAFDHSGALLISGGNRIWRSSNGVIAPLAGNGSFGSTGDGTDATQASIADPDTILVDQQGNVYFTEYSTARVRKILNGAISTVLDFSKFNVQPGSHGLLIDSVGRLVLANPSGLLRFDGIKLQTIAAYAMKDPYSMLQDPAGNIYVSDRGANQIVKFPASGSPTVIAGTGTAGFGGDGDLAARALLNAPSGLAMDQNGTLYIADSGNQRVRTITPDGVMHTIAGSGIAGFAGDNTTADFAAFQNPSAVALDASGNVFVADSGNNRVRKLTLAVVPTPKPAAVVHAESGSPNIAPGGLFSVYGDLLSTVDAQTQTANWPRSLAGVSVSINGIPAPLWFVSKGLINGQVPYEVQPGPATVIVTVNGSLPAQVSAQVVPANPGLFLYQGRALAVNADGSINGPDAPAKPGNFMILYVSGIGIPDHPVATGAPSPSTEPFARVAYPYTITVNGSPVQVPYFGLAPGYPALAQANIFVPNLPPGDYPVVVTVNGVQSNSANISIR